MRWSTLFCICLLLSVVFANATDSAERLSEPSASTNADVRPKRHLSTLVNIKKAIIGKVFGSSAPAESYKLYHIPGHDNILVKAVPKIPENSGEVPIEIAANPTIALLESYLGTNTSNETLKALDGVKNLLKSGIITNDALLDKLLVPIQPPKITYRMPQVSQRFPSVFRVPLAIEPRPFPIVNMAGKPDPIQILQRVIVKKPISVIPEAPVLPPLSFLPDVVIPKPVPAPKPVLVEEGPIIFKEILNAPRVEIPDYRPVDVSKIPSYPFVQKGYENPYKVPTPAFGKPLYPGAFIYQQFYNDGTVAQYTDSKIKPVFRPAVLPPPLVQRVQVISEKVVQKEPEYVKIPQFVNIIPEAPKLPDTPISIIEPEVKIPQNPTEYGPVFVEKIPKNPTGFTYHQYHEDGSVTLFGDGSKPLARPVVLPSVVSDRIDIISDKMTGPKPQNVIFKIPKLPEEIVEKAGGHPGYSYHQIKNDGSVTTYSGDGKYPAHQYMQVIPESHRRPYLHISDVTETEIIKNSPEFGVKVHTIPKNPSGFSYHQVHDDGSETIFTGADVVAPVVAEPSKYSTLFLNRPSFSEIKHPFFGPIVYMGNIPDEKAIPEPPKLSMAVPNAHLYSNKFGGYPQVYNDGSITSYPGADMVIPAKRPAGRHPLAADRYQEISEKNTGSTPAKPAQSGYSYHLINDQETVTTIADGAKPLPEPPKLSTLLNSPEVTVIEAKTPQQVAGGHISYSYTQTNSDGSVTTFPGGDAEHKDSATNVEVPVSRPKPQTPSAYQENEQLVIIGSAVGQNGQQHVDVFDVPNKGIKAPEVELPKKPSSGFSYQQTNYDGSLNTYVGSGVKVTTVETPEIPASPSPSHGDTVVLGLPKKPCTMAAKCVVETKVEFPSPVVSRYEYKQLVQSNPNKKFTIVNIEDGLLRSSQEASVSVTPIPPRKFSRVPTHPNITKPSSTEGPLAVNPIVVPEDTEYSYKQIGSDGSTMKIEGSNQLVTVRVRGEVGSHKTVQRGDIPEE